MYFWIEGDYKLIMSSAKDQWDPNFDPRFQVEPESSEMLYNFEIASVNRFSVVAALQEVVGSMLFCQMSSIIFVTCNILAALLAGLTSKFCSIPI